MMKWISNCCLFVMLLLSITAHSADQDFCSVSWNSEDTKEFFLLVVTEPIPFKPVTKEEMIDIWNIKEGVEQPVSLSEGESIIIDGDFFKIIKDGIETQRFSINEYLGTVNNLEQDFNQYGYSIRATDDAFNWVKINDNTDFWRSSQSLDLLYEQSLNALKVKAKEKAGDCLLTIVDPGVCPLIQMSDVFAIDGVYSGRALELADGSFITIDKLVNSINNTAKLHCAKGSLFFNPSDIFSYNYDAERDYNIGFEVDDNGRIIESNDRIWISWDSQLSFDEFVAELIYLVDLAELEDSGENSLLSPFLIAAKQGLKLMGDYGREIAIYATNVTADSMVRLALLIYKYPETAEDIYDAANYIKKYRAIPSVKEPVKPNLALKKRKDWNGLNFGNKKVLGTDAVAWYELRGGDEALSAQAFGDASGYIFNKKLQFLGASGDFYVGNDEVHALMSARIFGYTWGLGEEDSGTEGKYRADLTLINVNDEIPLPTFNKGYAQAWPVGPVAVIVELGAKATTKLKYGFALTATSIYGSIGPEIKAFGYAEAEVSIVVLAVGAEANITFLNSYVPLVGRVGAKFSPKGEPYLAFDLDATARYTALDGKVSVFAKYYVPRFGLPPWKKKKSSKTLFDWTGINAEHKIMSWGLTYGYDGVESVGDILDQTDIEHAEELDNQVMLVNRATELVKYQNTTLAAYNNSISAIIDDLNENQGLKATSESIQQASLDVDESITEYTTKLENTLNSL